MPYQLPPAKKETSSTTTVRHSWNILITAFSHSCASLLVVLETLRNHYYLFSPNILPIHRSGFPKL